MKLRIKGDSLRLRVSQSEVARLLDTGRIEETIHFGSDERAKLTYAVEHRAEATAMTLRYEPQKVTAVISSIDAHRWAEGQDVGLYGENLSAHGSLKIAVEKDFACLDKNDAENVDAFPHPRKGAVC